MLVNHPSVRKWSFCRVNFLIWYSTRRLRNFFELIDKIPEWISNLLNCRNFTSLRTVHLPCAWLILSNRLRVLHVHHLMLSLHHSCLVLMVGQVSCLLTLGLGSALGHFARDFYDKTVGDSRGRRRELVDWQIESEKERLDQPLLHYNLIEVRQHVIDACEVRHQQFKAE